MRGEENDQAAFPLGQHVLVFLKPGRRLDPAHPCLTLALGGEGRWRYSE